MRGNDMGGNLPKVSRKKMWAVGIIAIVALFFLLLAGSIFETVDKGTYHVIQRPFSGKMEAKLDPGMYWQFFSDVSLWPKSETFFFTSDVEEGEAVDQSIEVRFNDGSVTNISGTTRVLLPTTEKEAVNLMTKLNFRNYNDLERRFIRPIIRKALRTTANLMDARQSYAELRGEFISWTWDQVENGVYKTEEVQKLVLDPDTNQMVLKLVKVIAKDASGNILRESNPLKGTGVTLAQFEVKKFDYPPKVRAQIAQQQENFMGIETAKAKAQRAAEEARTSEAEGKADLMKVRYTQLKEKEKAVIVAQQQKETAEINAQQLKAVAITAAERERDSAKLLRAAAAHTKAKEILLGQGEATRKKLVMAADGALKQKLEAYVETQKVWAEAFANRNVPQLYMAGGAGGGDTPDQTMFSTFMQATTVKAMKDLALDMKTSVNPNKK